jgi:hypothetical protein
MCDFLLSCMPQGSPSPSAIKQLLVAGADVNSRNPLDHNSTPLHVLAVTQLLTASHDEAGAMQTLLGLTTPQVS